MWSKNLKRAAILASVAMLLPTDRAFCEPTNIKGEIYSRSVPFQSPDQLGEYSVSGLWFPQEQIPFAGLSGPAIFVFKNVNSGKQLTVAVNAIALLDKDFWNKHKDFWNKHGVADADQLEPEALLEKLRGFGVAAISLSEDKRAKVGACGRLQNDPPSGQARRAEQCLHLGEAVVDLQDVDFDGKNELVFRHAGVGQRGGAAYEIVRIPEDGDLPPLAGDLKEPLRDIDWRSVINITRKQIIIEGSSGACDSTEATYSRGAYGMSMTHFWRSVMHEPDGCDAEDYALENQAEGIGRRLKLLSRKSLKTGAAGQD
jgi:hypothetical protein